MVDQTRSLNHCPKCGGPADNGHDRCLPPNPYWCVQCMKDNNLYPADYQREISVVDGCQEALKRVYRCDWQQWENDEIIEYSFSSIQEAFEAGWREAKSTKPVMGGCIDCGHAFDGHYEKCRWFEKTEHPDNSIEARIAFSKEHSTRQPVGLSVSDIQNAIQGAQPERIIVRQELRQRDGEPIEVLHEKTEYKVSVWNQAVAVMEAIKPYLRQPMREAQQPVDCRGAFEKWAEHEEDCNLARVVGREHYLDSWTQAAWTGWQAAWKPEREYGWKIIAECRDALSVALPYVGGSNFSDQYANKQVKEQIERCEIALTKTTSIEDGVDDASTK